MTQIGRKILDSLSESATPFSGYRNLLLEAASLTVRLIVFASVKAGISQKSQFFIRTVLTPSGVAFWTLLRLETLQNNFTTIKSTEYLEIQSASFIIKWRISASLNAHAMTFHRISNLDINSKPILPEALHPYTSISSFQERDAPRFFTADPFSPPKFILSQQFNLC
jgi:hypothetical protein